MIRPRRIGLLGGTFDPVHIAHLHIAECAMHDLGLDEVRFIPAGSPPHKPNTPVSPPEVRWQMLEIATQGIAGFVPDSIDLAGDTPSYTSDLLARVRLTRPNDHLWFIIGTDSLKDFGKWHQPDRILELARLAVAERPGWDLKQSLAASSIDNLAEHVDTFASVPLDLSATRIRERVHEGQPVEWLVHHAVHNFIHDRGLYRTTSPDAR